MKIELSGYRASVKHWKGPAVQICRGLALEPAFNAQDTSRFVEQNAHGDSSATSSLILANLFRHQLRHCVTFYFRARVHPHWDGVRAWAPPPPTAPRVPITSFGEIRRVYVYR